MMSNGETAARTSHAQRTVRSREQGFSLTEMMVVVAIIGILSGVAVMSFRRYTVRVRVGEAYSMLGLIKAREEIYRAEFNQYASAAYHPAGVPGVGQPLDWGTGAGVPADWQQVGVRPDRNLYFIYQVSAGPPNAVGPVALDASGGATTPGYPLVNDSWFVASAKADIDGDNMASYFELCDRCRAVWVSKTADFEGE